MKRIFTALAVSLFFQLNVPVRASVPENTAAATAAGTLMPAADINELYKNGDYQRALDEYSKITRNRPYDAAAWYNEGNALFRLKRTGEAVYAYSRAFKIDPRNQDIRFNLEYAMKHTGQQLVPDGMPRGVFYLYYFFSDNELKFAAVVSFWITCLIFAFFRLIKREDFRKWPRRIMYCSATLLLLSCLWGALRLNGQFHRAGVVVRAEGASLTSGPGENFKNFASAPEGRIVKLLSEEDGYIEVGLEKEGLRGWAVKGDIKSL